MFVTTNEIVAFILQVYTMTSPTVEYCKSFTTQLSASRSVCFDKLIVSSFVIRLIMGIRESLSSRYYCFQKVNNTFISIQK